MFDLKVGFSCNNNCIHCVVGSKRGTRDLTFSEIQKVVDSVPEGEPIQLTGGEITIRKDFTDIVEYCGLKGHKTIIQTNGTGLIEEVIQKIEPFVENVLIAIHSCDPYIHNLIIRSRKNENMFEKTLQGLRNLQKYSIPFSTQTVISKINLSSLYNTFAFIQKECPGVFMHLTYPHPLGEAWENRVLVCPSYKELKPFIQDCFRDFGPHLIVEAIPPCYIFPFYQNIECNLDANIKKNTLDRKGFDPACKNTNDFFNEEGVTQNYNINDLDSKRKGPKCKTCFYAKECLGVWREYVDIYRIHFDLFPIDIETPWEISLKGFLRIELDNLSYEEVRNILESNKDSKPVLIEIKNCAEKFLSKLSLAKAISQITDIYSFPISFLNIPKCYLDSFSKVINTYQEVYEKLEEKCSDCDFKNECLGFSPEIPYIETNTWR